MPGSAALSAITARLLGLLPTWFGIPESNRQYVATANTLPGFVACVGDDAIGVLIHQRHFPNAAEIHLFAVDPAWHRRGVGTALLDALESVLRADGVSLLQVKTLGPSHPDEGYTRTRKFYRAVGFQPLEEIHGLWDPGNPCLIMVKQLHGT